MDLHIKIINKYLLRHQRDGRRTGSLLLHCFRIEKGHNICTKARLSKDPAAMPTLRDAAIIDDATSFSCCLTLLREKLRKKRS